MHARNAASVLHEPVGAEISVVRPAKMCGHPCSCGSVGVPNFWTNHPRIKGVPAPGQGGTEGFPIMVAGNRRSPQYRPQDTVTYCTVSNPSRPLAAGPEAQAGQP